MSETTPHILIIEDLKMSQVILERHLRKLNPRFQIDVAESGTFALELFREKHHQLIFLDIQLPRIDGFALLKRLRELEQEKTSIIAYTAIAGNHEYQQFINAGFTDYLPKPVKRAALEQILAVYRS
ncbi:response regulator with CheY-like receiver domain and winged-helix DNA-binding domain [Leptolyngbya sp. PCC 7375]|nr:response regulator with CheY-like receiver domain and winged-helix DNA-binding domain [Leptolyngbya sp. PCC 7375]